MRPRAGENCRQGGDFGEAGEVALRLLRWRSHPPQPGLNRAHLPLSPRLPVPLLGRRRSRDFPGWRGTCPPANQSAASLALRAGSSPLAPVSRPPEAAAAFSRPSEGRGSAIQTLLISPPSFLPQSSASQRSTFFF